MNTLSLHHSLQKTGITYESIILILIPVAQSIPLLFHHDTQEMSSSQKVFIFLSFCIAGSNFCAQITFSFLKNQERVVKFRQIVRILVWILSIINIVENQIAFFEESPGIGQGLLLTYSIIGIYVLGVIQLLSINGEHIKKALVCFNVLYFSLRIAISHLDPILGVFAGILCLIILRFTILLDRINHMKPERTAKGIFDGFLFKSLLEDVEEGFIVLENNRFVYYSNQRSHELLDSPPEGLIAGLEQIKCFDSLPEENQLDIKEKAIESFLRREGGQGSNKSKSMPFSGNISRDDVILESGSNLLEHGEDSKNERAKSFASKLKLFADSEEKKQKLKRISYATITMSKFKKIKTRDSLRIKKRLSAKKTTMLPSKTNIENHNDELFSIEENGSEIKEESKSNSIYQRCQTIQGSSIFKDKIPANLKRLFQTMRMNDVLDIEKNHNNQLNSIGKEYNDCKYEFTGYVTSTDDQVQMLDVKLQPLYMKGQPFLIVRIKDKTEAEYSKWLKESDKERTDILSSVSHELRTPLNCIIAMLDIVQEHVSQDLIADYIHPASHSAKLLLSLVNDILDLSQSKAKTLKLVYSGFDLKEHLKNVVKLMDTQARGKELTLSLEYDERAPTKIYSEPNRLRQIIINLIGNAIKFTLKGTIVLRVEYVDTNTYQISINDTGVGIKPENMNKLFRQFSKVNDTSHINHQGVGLGLSISNTLVKMLSPNGLGISVNSVYGQGTTFSFEIESKPNMDFSERQEFNLSSEENDDRNVFDNINCLKTQNDFEQTQKSKVFNKRKSSIYRTSTIMTKNYSISNIGNEKDNLFGSLLQPGSIQSQKNVKDSGVSLNIQIPPTTGPSNNKVDACLYTHKTFRTLQSYEDPFLSIDRKSSARSKSLIEKENYFVVREQKDRMIQAIAKRINETTGQPCLLVVDDNSFNIIALKRIFQAMNLKIDSATSGDIAIQKILERNKTGENYRMVFMDCYMPIRDGYEVTREIRKLEKEKVVLEVPIIAVTASNSPRDLAKCYEVGMDDCLTKPIDNDMLKDLIIKYLGTLE